MDCQKQINDPEINKMLKEIEQLTMLKDLDIKSIADEGKYAEKLAERSRSRLKTTQLRRFFGAIKDIAKNLEVNEWNKVEADFYLLKPKLAYAKGRKLIPDEFYCVVKSLMNKIDKGDENNKKENFIRFVQFLEAVVAYHKFHGGD